MPHQPHAELFATAEDGRRYSRTIVITYVVMLALFIIEHFQPLPGWLIAGVMSLALARWMLLSHELFHIVDYDQAPALVRLVLVPVTPINIGYAEYRQLHAGHHQDAASAQDPDAFHIRGGHLRSLLGAMLFTEICTLQALRRVDITIRWRDVGIRLGVFAALLAFDPRAFLAVWLWLRLNYGLAIWIFFHHLHYRAGQYGTYPLPLPGWLEQTLTWLYGRTVVVATLHHDVHHRHPRVAARHLGALAGGA